jgi:hypothetical protein
MLIKYNDFRNSLNENVAQAKTYLKNRALRDKKERMGEPREGDPAVTLSQYEVKDAENDRDFLKIKDMVKDNAGYTYMFTKFFFEDLVEVEKEQRYIELSQLYTTLKDLRQSLSKLPLASLDAYTKIKPTEADHRGPYERLIDDIEDLKNSKLTTKWINKLLPWQKVWFDTPNPKIKERVAGIAFGFDQFGKEPDGTINAEINKANQGDFFLGVKRYKTVGELLSSAESHIKATDNASANKFRQAIINVNKKYGELNGAEVVYNEGGILIIEVRSYVANSELNSNTSHCIAKTGQSSWDTYVGDNKFAKQYYIYDYNLPQSDPKCVIGITIGEGGRINNCNIRNNQDFMDGIKAFIKARDIPMYVLAPMSPEEIEKKKRRMRANEKIVNEGLTLEEVRQYFEEGADPNAKNGKPLLNSVSEDNFEKTKYLLEMGANPNLSNCIDNAKNLVMIKLLVDNKAEMTDGVFNSFILNDIEAMEYVLAAGIDPDFKKGYPLRTAIRNENDEVIKLLIKHGAKISERNYLAVNWCVESYNLEILKYLFKRMKEQDDPKTNDNGAIDEWIFWCTSSDKPAPKNVKDEIINFLEAQRI